MKRSRRLQFLFGLLCSAAPCTAIFAEQPITLPKVTVRETDTPAAPLRPSLDEARVGLALTPGGGNLIDLQSASRLATLRDALDFQPGLVIQDFFGGIDQPRLNIRGSGIQSNPVNRGVLLLRDGLPMNEADGSFIIGLLEPRNAAYVEARRGANARNAAATTLGGELDFHSLTGVDEQARLRLENGSFGRQAWQAAAGTAGPIADARIDLTGDRYDGYRHHSTSRRDSGQATVGLALSDRFLNRTELSWTDLAFEIPTVVPKDRVYRHPTGVMGDETTPQDQLLNVYRRDPNRDVRQIRVANRSRWNDESFMQDLGLSWQDTQDEFNNQTSITVTDARTHRAQWRLAPAANAARTYRLALSWARSEMDRDLYATNPQTGQRLQRFGQFDLRARELNALATFDWHLTRAWTLAGTVLWSDLVRDARPRGAGSAVDQRWRALAPKAGILWQPADSSRWFANISRSHEAPTYWEIVASTVPANAPGAATAELLKLDLQRATTVELGGQGSITNGHLHWDITTYHSRVEDELIATTDSNGIKVGTYNYVGGTRHQGIEAGLSGEYSLYENGSLGFRLAWTLNDFRFRRGEFAGNRIAGIPRQSVSAELRYVRGGLSLGPTLHWQPDAAFIDHANTPGATQDAYAVLGFKVDLRASGWDIYLQADNLTDKRYASSYVIRDRATAEQPGYLPGNGRSVSVGVAWRLGAR